MLDQFVEIMYDLIAAYDTVVKETDPVTKERKKKEAFKHDGYFYRYLGRLEVLLTDEGPFLLQSKMTWADVVIMSFLELKQTPNFGREDLLSTFPRLNAQYNAVRKSIAVYLENRPKTPK